MSEPGPVRRGRRRVISTITSAACVVALGLGVAPVAATRQAKPAAAPQTPEWVARQIEARDTGRDSRMEMSMSLVDRQGRERERALTVTSLSAAAGRGERILVKFNTPNDIKGTGLLVWEHPTAADERFLFLPALGRVRRIAAAEQQESFVGSDLSYEDMSGREVDDYTYAFLQADATWTDPAGKAHPAWLLESTARDDRAAYRRTVSLVIKDSFVVAAADMYNRRDEREKRYEVRRLERVDGIWTAMHVVMVNRLQKTKTELVVNNARYNVGLTEADFTRRVLEQTTQ